jgi:phage tail-like protein
VYRLPKSVKHPKLVLKRGIATKNSPLVKWCKSVLEAGFIAPIETVMLRVFLLNEDKDPIRAWDFADVYPVKWEVDPFNSTKNEVAIEKIELSYTCSSRCI